MFFRLCMCSDSRRGFPDNLRKHMCVLKASRLSPAGFVAWAAKQGTGLNSAYQIDSLPAVSLYAEIPYSCSLFLFLDQCSVLFGILETFMCIFSYLIFWWCFSHMRASYSLEHTGFFLWLLLHWKRKAKSLLSGLFVGFFVGVFCQKGLYRMTADIMLSTSKGIFYLWQSVCQTFKGSHLFLT